MTKPKQQTPDALPQAVESKQWTRPSIAWLLPIAAMLVVVWLGYSAWRQQGETIEITFDHAHGIEVDDPVMYRGVRVGIVREVTLAPANSGIIVRVELRRDTRSIATSDARFWIVRPEVSLRGVTGLETLLGPRLIRVEPGTDPKFAREFVGLNAAPSITLNESALHIFVDADRLGSLLPGGPVLYRDVQVGQITSYELVRDTTAVRIAVEVDERFAPLITDTTKFWNASGIDLDIGLFNGVRLRSDSLESLLTGGIAFATPTKPGQTVGHNYVFQLESEPKPEWLRWKPSIDVGEAMPAN
ncbi:MAG: MCE family protein [Phycisphaeraceae bacterium]|nr:MCE family protein [Phycisphaerales bacterium]MCB9861190.1 MCE family protein [Phycisphaeraceae bacterium]